MIDNIRSIAGKDGRKDLVLLLGYIPLQIIISSVLTIFLLYKEGYAPTVSIINLQQTVMPMMQEKITVFSLFFASFITFIYILIAYKKLLKRSLANMHRHLKECIYTILTAYLVLYLVITTFSILTQIAVTGTQIELTNIIRGDNFLQKCMICATVILFVPIIEEMICRKIIMGFSHNFPELKWVLYCISSALFGFFHYSIGSSLYTLIPYVFMGFVLGAAYLKTKNILVPIAIHILNNLISIVAIIALSYI